jgi:F-type H+-transporting ATPase subunit alpha
MKTFAQSLKQTGEIGTVTKVLQSLVYVSGLPQASPDEIVIFESGEVGQIMTLNKKHVEVLLLSASQVRSGTKVARSGENLKVAVGDPVLGKVLNPLGYSYSKSSPLKAVSLFRSIDVPPPTISTRKNITQILETGISWVDLVVPLGKGQRELVIGDRKIGKTSFLLQIMGSLARRGTICVYAAVGKRRLDIKMIEEYITGKGLEKNVVVVASSASDPPGLVFITPFTAMTIAEYFRDTGRDVLLVLDDMTAHAKYYREVSLLANRFPGRSSYPGDIFYVQSRLLERAGNFISAQKHDDGTITQTETSITCLPVAELVLGDISGYIQTNLMAITDGHILFDRDLYNQGRRPAINPFLSVTRVGHQAQTPLMRDISQKITSFLVHLDKLRQYMHFGAELSEATLRTLSVGEKIHAFMEQSNSAIVPLNINAVLLTALWTGFWKEDKPQQMKEKLNKIISAYTSDETFAGQINAIIDSSNTFSELITMVQSKRELIMHALD